MNLTGLDHLVLTVADVDATVAFYTGVLRMRVQELEGGRIGLRFGDQRINLHQAGAEVHPHARRPTPGSADLCFVLDAPLPPWQDHLASLGVEVVAGPYEQTGAVGEMTSIYIRDPDGNLIELASYA